MGLIIRRSQVQILAGPPFILRDLSRSAISFLFPYCGAFCVDPATISAKKHHSRKPQDERKRFPIPASALAARDARNQLDKQLGVVLSPVQKMIARCNQAR
jgi:hypothetical protein